MHTAEYAEPLTPGRVAALGPALSAATLAALFLSVPEVVVRDFAFGSGSQRPVLGLAILLMLVLFLLQMTGTTYRIYRTSLAAWLLFCASLLGAFAASGVVIPVLIAQPTMIFLFATVFRECEYAKYARAFLVVGIFLCVSPMLSFVVHFLTPFDVVIRAAFTDFIGHKQSIVFTSFSPSIYGIGALSIPRMSSFFDEPGTFGFFASMFGALLFLRGRVGLARLVFICGLSSFSTAYLLFFVLTAPIWLTKKFHHAGIAVLLAIGVALLLWYTTPDALKFFLRRFLYAFGQTHNRTVGWRMSITSLRAHPLFGSYLSGYATREIPASGILVLMAYFGVPAVISLLVLVFGELSKQVSRLGYPRYDWKAAWVVGVAVVTTIANRNNFFNYSGFTIALFAIVAASAPLRDQGDRETT